MFLANVQNTGYILEYQAPDTVFPIPRFLYQCHVYSFNACCSGKNSRSSNAMLQVSLIERDGTHHNLFRLLLILFLSSYFFPSGLTPRREKVAFPTPLKGL
jgi:hypothetical protein